MEAEPGHDPVSGRPWGEHTPGKRVASYAVGTVMFAVATVYLLVEGVETARDVIGLVLVPVATVFCTLAVWRAWGEYRAGSSGGGSGDLGE